MGNKLDLTLREVEFAKQHGLNAETFLKLKDYFSDEYVKNFHAKLEEKIRKEITSDLRKQLTPEIREALRADVEREISQKTKDDIRTGLRKELLSNIPSPADRNEMRSLARELELDVLTSANVISTRVQEQDQKVRRSRTLRRVVFWALFVSLTPALLATYVQLGESTRVPSLVALGLTTLLWLVTVIALGTKNNRYMEQSQTFLTDSRKLASDYWCLAERAKALRLVDAMTVPTKDAITEVLKSFLSSKSAADRDFFPSAKDIERARIAVRDQIAVDLDPDKIFRDYADAEIEQESSAKSSS